MSIRQTTTSISRKVLRPIVHVPGWVLPYLGMVGRLSGDDPRFRDFQSDWDPILYLNTILLTPHSSEKISLSRSHLVTDNRT